MGHTRQIGKQSGRTCRVCFQTIRRQYCTGAIRITETEGGSSNTVSLPEPKASPELLRQTDIRYRYLSVRRADYQKILHEAALETDCELRLGQKITDVKEDLPGVQLQDGSVVHGDLVVIADGRCISVRA
jgi:2-polyprenyl-6-methoxyphenol hydroxylase-like FAD-dependent oxidoreductase